MLRIGASSGAQVLRNIAGIPSGPLDLEVSSWRRVWRTFRVENLMGDIVNFGREVVWLEPLVVQVRLGGKDCCKKIGLG